jgi:hypothetical protein
VDVMVSWYAIPNTPREWRSKNNASGDWALSLHWGQPHCWSYTPSLVLPLIITDWRESRESQLLWKNTAAWEHSAGWGFLCKC